MVEPSEVSPQCCAIAASSCETPSAANSMRKHVAPQVVSLDWKKCGTIIAHSFRRRFLRLDAAHLERLIDPAQLVAVRFRQWGASQ